MNEIPNINMLYEYAQDNSEYNMIKEMFLSALFFNTSAAMALKNIRIKRKSNNGDKLIIPNYFGITFANSGCVDRDTEFLTPNGWKKISDYIDGDLVLQWNPDNSTQFVKPINYISEPEYRDCYYIDGGRNSNTNRFLCPDHRVPYIVNGSTYNGKKYENKFMVKEAKELFEKKTTITFPVSFDSPEREGLDLTDTEIRLQVAFFADGTITNRYKDYNGKIRVKKQYKIDRLKQLLDENNSTYKISLSGEYSIFWINIKIQEKIYNNYWYKCNNHQLSIVFDESNRWDGSTTKDGRKIFRTTIKESADFMQYVYATQTKNYVSYILKERHDKIPFNTEYRIVETTNKTKSITKRMVSKKQMPDLMKYCFTVDSSFWVARRNGFISIEGNCGKNHSDNIAKTLFKDSFRKFETFSAQFYDARKDSDGKGDQRYVNLSSYFVPVSSTWQALQKAAQTVKDMDAGSVNIVADELG